MNKILALFAPILLTGCCVAPPLQSQQVQTQTVRMQVAKVCDNNGWNCQPIYKEVAVEIRPEPSSASNYYSYEYRGYPRYYGVPPVTAVWGWNSRPLCWKKNRWDCR